MMRILGGFYLYIDGVENTIRNIRSNNKMALNSSIFLISKVVLVMD
jgi:hypothetical protein